MNDQPVLEVQNLHVRYRANRRWYEAISGFEITVCPGQIYGVVGESGSGKSTAIKAIIRYLGKNGKISEGQILLNGEDIAHKPRRQLNKLWAKQMHMLPQNPFSALNPALRVGEQVAETIRIRDRVSRSQARAKAIAMLERVRLADAKEVSRRYPHELSGGMQQRIVLAMAFSASPQILMLDEPTTSLDVTTEATILDIIRDLVQATQAGAIYVTHDLGVVAQLCERVAVMYAGEIVEDAPVQDLYANPLHPYTIGLIACVPRLGQTKSEAILQTIPGRPPSLQNRGRGCIFAPRCPVAVEQCFVEHPPLEQAADGRKVRCHRWHEIASGELVVEQAFTSGLEMSKHLEREPLLSVENLTKYYDVPRGLLDFLQGKPASSIKAVDGVNLGIQQGHTLGLVGESGSGKTTLARMIVGLISRTDGKIELKGKPIGNTVRQRNRDALRQIQMVFQNPQDSLNPYLTIGQAIRRPLMRLAKHNRQEAEKEVRRLLNAVNLDESYINRFPAILSGGERQRVAIARAFASLPDLIVCDEPVSALDVSVQAAVLNLLARLQAENDTSYLFISHNLAVVGYLADYLIVMYLGQIFEVGYGHDLFAPPYHPYTEALVSAIPIPDPNYKTQQIRLSNDIPSPRNLPTGCRFHTRCPRKIGSICEQEVPPWQDDGDGHYIRCHIPLEELTALQQSSPLPQNQES
ncbi:MAG: ABC transporter ATP-binding protein [Chloroflexi bacterium]|nr:ABC transporter ATP-binding protein [Chloroflexota bacterium]